MKLTLTVFLTALISFSAAAQTTLTVRADSWFPFNGDPKDMQPGYVVELMREIFPKQGITIDYQMMPWSRALSETRKGAFDAVIGALTSDAPDFIYPQEACGIADNSFYVLTGQSWKYAGISSLENVNIGIINDYSYGEAVDAYIAKNKADAKKITVLNGENAIEQGLMMLQKGRLGVLVENDNVIKAKIKKLKLLPEQFQNAGTEGTPELMYVAFSPAKPDSKKHAEIWSKGVNEMRANGTLAKVLATYGVTDWKK
jgi:polar amino acid transport system substrate-binding protein